MASYEPASYRRWTPKDCWLQVVFHPAEAGKHYTVRQGTDGEPFTAYYTYDHEWRHVLPDANGDGTRELGPRLTETNRLYRLSKV